MLVLHLPPLRERPEDLLPLANHFVARHAGSVAGRDVRLGPGVEASLRGHRWPGNVRELENVVQRALVACRGGVIGAPEIDEALGAVRTPGAPTEIRVAATSDASGETFDAAAARLLPAAMEEHPEGTVYAAVLARTERKVLELALARFGGNQVQAARWLGINRNTLRARLLALGIAPDRR